MRPLLLAGGALLAYMLLRGSKDRAVQNRYYAGIRAQMTGARLQGKGITVTIKFQNPNSEPAVVRSVFGEVSLNGRKVGLVSMSKPVTVAGNGETSMDLQVQMKLPNIITSVAELLKGIANSVIDLTGTMNVNNSPIPIKLTYTLQPA